ncbi:uncharacterized protein FIBRA_00190 [Fibroporia radiculosa]|uniref:Uncharacterized protein n=1 Tax=Fibroporia radiculosa TaxID=599839 RepID=J7SBX2_9APHY|nr:uncharacterized protein FIBRA_00190 [Fibroporia radiculosa]CCL98196.1 predicted protein [Fibroporia radiculosa]
MPSPLVAHAIHEILTTVESSFNTASVFISSQTKTRRARMLVTEALNILDLLRDDMNEHDMKEYNFLHSRADNAVNYGGTHYFDAAEALWDFALRTFQEVDHREIIAADRARRERRANSPPPSPPVPNSTTLVQNVKYFPAIQYTPAWIPIQHVCWSPGYAAIPNRLVEEEDIQEIVANGRPKTNPKNSILPETIKPHCPTYLK